MNKIVTIIYKDAPTNVSTRLITHKGVKYQVIDRIFCHLNGYSWEGVPTPLSDDARQALEKLIIWFL